MSIESGFAKALGRQPTPLERERLHRLRDAFDIRDNDALWIIVMVLEYYDDRYRQYPEQITRVIENSTAGWRSRTSSGDADRELRLVTVVGLGTACSVLFGAGCMALGASIQGRGTIPCWSPKGSGFAQTLAAVVLSAPAGWIVPLVLAVPAFYTAAWGWTRGRDPSRNRTERAAGWLTAGSVGLLLMAWLALLLALPE